MGSCPVLSPLRLSIDWLRAAMRMAKTEPRQSAPSEAQPPAPRSDPVQRERACSLRRRFSAARSLRAMSFSALMGWWFSSTSTLATSCGRMLFVASE